MDYLDRLMQLTKIEGEINILCRFQGDWQVPHQQTPDTLGIFHLILMPRAINHSVKAR